MSTKSTALSMLTQMKKAANGDSTDNEKAGSEVQSIADELDAPDMPSTDSDDQSDTVEVQKTAKKTKKTKKEALKDAPVDMGNVKTLSQQGDVLSDTVNMIENLGDELEAMKLAHETSDKAEFYDFTLGGILSKIQAEGWLHGYESMKDLIESEFGFKYRKGVYLINTYNFLVSLGLPYSLFSGIGWKKIALIAPELTNDNYEEWIDRAKSSTVPVLQDYITQLKAHNGDKAAADKEVKSLTTKSFKLHEDQKEVIADAIDDAKKKGNTESDAHALEYICTEYLAGGTVVKKTKDKFDPATANIKELRSNLLAAVKAQNPNELDQILAYCGEINDSLDVYEVTAAEK